MPTVNTSCIQSKYDEQLARLYYTVNYTPNDVLSYALSGVNLNDVSVIVAQDVESLPNLQYETPNLPDGMVYFVQSLGIIVISSNNTWLTLDGVIVRNDTFMGLIYAWGQASGIGDGTITNRSSPVSVVGGFTDWCQVSAGQDQSLGIRTNGTLWAWGNNDCGQLGDGTITNRSSPVSVVGGFTDWCQASAGGCNTVDDDMFSLAVRQNGTAWAWGGNCRGQLGIGIAGVSAKRSSPVSVVGGFCDWCQVAAGGIHSLGVRTNGTLWSWGSNSRGQLGDGTSTNQLSPVSVIGGFCDWCQISAGNSSLAVRTNGTAWAWGSNICGELGNNSQASFAGTSSPVSVVGGFTDWCQVSMKGNDGGNTVSSGVRQNGTLWTWGSSSWLQLGNSVGGAKSSPASVVGGFTDWCQVSIGMRSSFGVRTNGTLWAWGQNGQGQLGDNTVADRSSPVSVVGGFTDWRQVSAGNQALGIRNVE